MKNSFLLTVVLVFTCGWAHADIEWSGTYRFEGRFIKNSDLNDRGKELSYGQHHLILRPRIVAGDGLTIFGQFNILNSSNYANSQMGQIWGSGIRTGNKDATTSAQNSNTLSERQKADTLEVSELYLTLTQEYGSLIVGRAPVQFGLGMTHNAGRGAFDHWYDSRDLVGYKIIVGNLSFFPMFGKPSEGDIGRSDDLNDYMIQFQYENPETDIEMGVFYQVRKGGDQGSDAPIDDPGGTATPAVESFFGANSSNNSGVNIKQVNLYALRDSEQLRLGIEAAFQSGELGVQTANGDKVSMDGFGIAGELEYRPTASKWKWGLKSGIATGDDPATKNKYEAFIFDRNYDVAMLMFNHPMGQADFLRTGLLTGSVRDANTGAVNQADVEAISNLVYAAPTVTYTFNDRWSLQNTIVTGWLNTNPLEGKDVSKDMGYEWDISLNFMPRKGVVWVNQAGFLFPGAAWEGGNQYDSSNSFGLATKASISF